MSLARKPMAPRRVHFSLHAMLVAMVWVAMFFVVRAMVFRSNSFGEALDRTMSGRTLFAVVGGIYGARTASHAGVKTIAATCLGMLLGCAASTLYLLALSIEFPMLDGTVYADGFQWPLHWEYVVKCVFIEGTFVGAIYAAVAAMLWQRISSRK